MSDPSSAFLAAAFVAGVIEGSSVLRYYRKVAHEDAASSVTTPCFAAHVVLYGAVSLPLGLIGASPGVAFCPRSLKPSITAHASVNSQHVQSLEKHNEAVKASEGGVSHNSELRDTFTASPLVSGTGRGIGRILREENLKKTMHSTNSYHHRRDVGEPSVLGAVAAESNLAPASSRCDELLFSQNSTLSRYVATLDGRSLPTPLSEAMRRSRCVFIGAALVSLAVTQYLATVHQNKMFQASDGVACGLIVDENGRIDHTHNSKLTRRLRADIASEAVAHRESINRYVSSFDLIRYRVKSFSEKAQKVALNGLCNAVETLESRFGRSLDFTPFNWLIHWKNTVSSCQNDPVECRPIAIRLIMNDDKISHSFSSPLSRGGFCYSSLPWLSPTKKEDNDYGGHEKHSPFFVLPLFISGYQGLSYHLNKSSHPSWMLEFEPRPFNELPINSSWLLSNVQKKGVNTVQGEYSKSSTHSTNNSSSRLLVVEANTSRSIHEVLRRRYAEKNTNLNVNNDLVTAANVVAFARMLLNLARAKSFDYTKTVTASTILIHCEDQVALKDQQLQSWNQLISINAFDLLKWALIASINNICNNHEQVEKVIPDDVASENTSETSGVSYEFISNGSSDDKDVAALWTIVDVLGTSIRRLFQSTYRIASTVTILGQQQTLSGNKAEHKKKMTNIPKVIHVVSSCESATKWLEETLSNRDWKVKAFQPNDFFKNEISSGGILFILGKNDLETCELASSIIECPAIWRHPNTKLLISLNDPSMYET
ncbi:hypothetical protein ACHAWX_000814, partial [Stephanocyclus meneghinianus]